MTDPIKTIAYTKFVNVITSYIRVERLSLFVLNDRTPQQSEKYVTDRNVHCEFNTRFSFEQKRIPQAWPDFGNCRSVWFSCRLDEHIIFNISMNLTANYKLQNAGRGLQPGFSSTPKP